MTPEEIQEFIKRTHKKLATQYGKTDGDHIYTLTVAVADLLIAVEALAAHVAAQATDGK